MSVNFQHNDYTSMLPQWKKARDCAKGQRAVHDAGTCYLPMLGEQSSPEYEAYKARTPFYNATWRTIDGLRGMIFRKPPLVESPASIKPMMDDVTLQGEPLQMFLLDIVEEALTTGRMGIFIDYPMVDISNATRADELRNNFRPMMKLYCAEAIINWKTKTIKNKTVLSMVVLAETGAVAKDEFEDVNHKQYRVLDLVEVSEEFVYRVRVFTVDKDGKDQLMSTVYPLIGGKPIDNIPFQFISVDDVNWAVDEPPLMDLVDMNISHYCTTADYEHGCHFTGLPTPVITGYTMDPALDTTFSIGSMSAWIFPNQGAKAEYLEFTGQGLGALERNLAKKENYMAVLGARMLEAQVRGVESANTASIHRGGEQSMLASIAQAISIGFTKALQTFAAFAGETGVVKVELNRDFFPAPMDSLMLTALIAAWQNGAIGYSTLFDKMKQGEIVKFDGTPDEEQTDIKKYPAPMQVAGTTPGSSSPNANNKGAKATIAEPTQTQLQHK